MILEVFSNLNGSVILLHQAGTADSCLGLPMAWRVCFGEWKPKTFLSDLSSVRMSAAGSGFVVRALGRAQPHSNAFTYKPSQTSSSEPRAPGPCC